jgi:hypothetical protein
MKLDKQLKLDKQFGDIVGAANVLTDPNDTRA